MYYLNFLPLVLAGVSRIIPTTNNTQLPRSIGLASRQTTSAAGLLLKTL